MDRYLPGPPAPNRGAAITSVVIVGGGLAISVGLTVFGVAFDPTRFAITAGTCALGLFGLFMVWFLWSAKKFYAETDVALAALIRGDFEVAAKVWAGWHARRAPEMVRAQAGHNLGWTVIRQGDPRRAIEILGSNDRRLREGLVSAGLAATTAQDLALAYALIGDVDTADIWFAESERRATSKSPSTYKAMRAFVRAVIDCRAGKTKEAARALKDEWAELEKAPEPLLRPLRVIRAFAGNAGGLGSIPPAYPDEYRFLAVEWPELATWLERQWR